MGVAIVLAIAIAMVIVKRQHPQPFSPPPAADSVAISGWWTTARTPFGKLRDAVDNVDRGLQELDRPAVEQGCQQMHDIASVDLRTLLPTPDARITAELSAATDDTHAAAHMCLAILAGSPNNYDAEFMADIDQARRHLDAAQDIINETLTTT